MSAQVVQLGSSVAERYAKLMTLEYNPEDRNEAISAYMDFAERLVANGFTRSDLQHMIEGTRARLIRQLAEINRI